MIFENISALCKEKGITISALEKAVGLGNATVRGWETSSPRIENLRAVAEYFGVSIDHIVSMELKEK